MSDSASPILVAVNPDLEELIPGFLANRARELAELKEALGRGDLAQIRAIGHRLRGVAGSYGFGMLTPLARELEQGGGEGNAAVCERAIAEYAQLLPRLQVTYLDPDA